MAKMAGSNVEVVDIAWSRLRLRTERLLRNEGSLCVSVKLMNMNRFWPIREKRPLCRAAAIVSGLSVWMFRLR